ncbi:hypothetical protein HID58_003423 [Brassica napus]|uniref:BnaA01g29860D protein n=2 Tax=Brassica napus TaxID=3708 RepID=A0A078HXT7_BRANA|nr:hypothetical protein HID58_003423 [Brassica napus]CAF2155370.1 unnamed protein product [Brassica napus]CDY43355.1 BnaA01g29860D [Brassica napus]
MVWSPPSMCFLKSISSLLFLVSLLFFLVCVVVGTLVLKILLSWHGEKPRDINGLTKLVDKYMRLKLLSLKGRGDYYEEGLITWFGVQPSS